MSKQQNPLIVQGDMTLLMEVHSPLYEEVRDHLVRFAELLKSPEHIHTYKITPLSIWNASAAGYLAEEMIATLQNYAKYEVPTHVLHEIEDYAGRYGQVKLVRSEEEGFLLLQVSQQYLAEELAHYKELKGYFTDRLDDITFRIPLAFRGKLKIELIKTGWPAEDLIGYVSGEKLPLRLRSTTSSGLPFSIRDYQKTASEIFYAGGGEKGGSGVIVLPCGAGKTVVAISVMAKYQVSVLILTTSVSAVRQWKREILDKIDIDEEMVGEYSGHCKEIRPITISTYQIITYRKNQEEEFAHFQLFQDRDWGLIVYDEVHVLPAPIFQITAEIQSRRRLGLTATLVREDGLESDVFALIGPKKYDVPWKVLEKQSWIAKATCYEVRIPLPNHQRMEYAIADARTKFRIASENSEKLHVIRSILERHSGTQTLIIGQYIEQLESLAKIMDLPLINGKTPQKKRDAIFHDFRCCKFPVLIVSKVANFALDLPDAEVAIQVSGTYGSRQEEAQRLGRILRPKQGENQAHFYTIVSRDTTEVEFARNRQLFLTEQGYAYEIMDRVE
jgi:DNA excision repair protein ERCC-3